jgi:hypothetical protein
MANFVLVHGAWHGGWCYRDTAKALKKIQEDTLGRKEFGRGAFDFGDRRAGGHELAVISQRLSAAATAVSSEDHIEQAKACEDHRATGDHAGPGASGASKQGRGRIARPQGSLG